MAINMKLDVGSLLKGLTAKKKGGGESQSPYQSAIIAGTLVVILAIAYGYFIYLPGQEEIRQKQAMIDSTEELRGEVLTLTQEILTTKIKLQEDKYRYEELSRLFHDKKELEDLYRNISLLALTYELMVVKLEKGKETPIFKETVVSMDDGLMQGFDENAVGSDLGMEGQEDLQNEGDPSEELWPGGEGEISKKEVAFYKISVRFDFSGDYLNYTYFRKDLAELKKIINIELETIEVPATDGENGNPSDGSVQITTILSTYRFPSSDTERYIIDQESDI